MAVNGLVCGVHDGALTPELPAYKPSSPPSKSFSRYLGYDEGRRGKPRTFVGLSNRFRLSARDTLGKDLLATTQLLRSIRIEKLASVGRQRDEEATRKRPATQPVLSRLRTSCRRFNNCMDSLCIKSAPVMEPESSEGPSPTSIFHYHSKRAIPTKGPDVLLQCHGITWELHKPYIRKSHTLSGLLQHAVISATACYEDSLPVISLPFSDTNVTRQSLARALGLLYEDQFTVSPEEVVSVLAAASLLLYPELQKECCEVMLRCINASTVSMYYLASTKYKQPSVKESCESWLQLNLIPQLSLVINLRQLPFELFERTLCSSRLFTWNEYSLFKLICTWIFLQIHPHMQLMPAHSFAVTYFQHLPRTSAFLQSEKGQSYASLFNCIRLQSIVEAAHLEEMERMNILSATHMLRLFKLHHLALHNGGDMACVDQFSKRAVRIGFIVEQQWRYHVQTISIYGFHFELKAEWTDETQSVTVSLKRLRPGDPAVNMHISEKEPVFLRAERLVCYSAELHYKGADGQRTATRGQVLQMFGLNDSNRSTKVMKVDRVILPAYIKLNILFPPTP